MEAVPYEPPTAPGTSAGWLAENASPLSSLDSDDYTDLQFLKSFIGDRRIVQLGESGHGVGEFNRMKVRLIKFLHEEMGFDVIAFESGLFECFQADRDADFLSARQLMTDCIFGVWHTKEVLSLFEYIKENRGGEQPLMLAGFDMQPSSHSYRDRFDFLPGVVRALDHGLAAEVELWERKIFEVADYGGNPEWMRLLIGDDLLPLHENYEGLLGWFETHEEDLLGLFPGDPTTPRVARQLVWSTLKLLERALTPAGAFPCLESEVRDRGMAGNLAFLVRSVFPKEKVIVWAHNLHIRYDNRNTRQGSLLNGGTGCFSMGEQIASRHRIRDGVYTIGLYMNQGSAAHNDGSLYGINPAPPGYLESFLNEAGEPLLFLDLLHTNTESAPTWVTSNVATRPWGTGRLFMVPRDQYDGLLFIREVHPPDFRLRN